MGNSTTKADLVWFAPSIGGSIYPNCTECCLRLRYPLGHDKTAKKLQTINIPIFVGIVQDYHDNGHEFPKKE